jgi:hypothetical protein
MHLVAATAVVRKHRVTVAGNYPMREAEKAFSGQVMKTIEAVRGLRDNIEEAAFRRLYT